MARLVCLVCGHVESVPIHHGEEMMYRQKGNFRRFDYLVCGVCGLEIPVPRHCGIPMLYVVTDYTPVSPLTEREIQEYKAYYLEVDRQGA